MRIEPMYDSSEGGMAIDFWESCMKELLLDWNEKAHYLDVVIRVVVCHPFVLLRAQVFLFHICSSKQPNPDFLFRSLDSL